MTKNYLAEDELQAMARIMNAYLDLAELKASDHIPMTMADWAAQFDGILRLTGREVLDHAGSISASIAQNHALSEFEKYRVRQDRLFESDFDRYLITTATPLPLFPEEDNGSPSNSEGVLPCNRATTDMAATGM